MRGDGVAFLVVDDEAVVRRALVSVLKPHGTCGEADSLARASFHVAQRKWDGLLLDVRLGDGSGLDLLAEVRRRHLSAPAVILSGSLDHEIINRAAELDARILSKPFCSSALTPFLVDVARRTTSSRVHAAAERARLRWHLSEREEDIVLAAVEGRTREDYLSAAAVSCNTYKTQVRRLLEKTGHDNLHALALQLWNDQ